MHGASLVAVLTVSWTGAVVWLLTAILHWVGGRCCCLYVGAQQYGWVGGGATGVDLDRRSHVDHRDDAFPILLYHAACRSRINPIGPIIDREVAPSAYNSAGCC